MGAAGGGAEYVTELAAHVVVLEFSYGELVTTAHQTAWLQLLLIPTFPACPLLPLLSYNTELSGQNHPEIINRVATSLTPCSSDTQEFFKHLLPNFGTIMNPHCPIAPDHRINEFAS